MQTSWKGVPCEGDLAVGGTRKEMRCVLMESGWTLWRGGSTWAQILDVYGVYEQCCTSRTRCSSIHHVGDGRGRGRCIRGMSTFFPWLRCCNPCSHYPSCLAWTSQVFSVSPSGFALLSSETPIFKSLLRRPRFTPAEYWSQRNFCACAGGNTLQ